jgi:hypothetical protein
LTRVARIETSLASMRAEASAAIDERVAGFHSELAALRQAHERSTSEAARAASQAAARLDSAETVLGSLDLAGRDSVLSREIVAVAQHLADLQHQVEELERKPPQVEPVTWARVDSMSERTDALASAVAAWQARIEEQAGRVRAAEISAEKQATEAGLLLEAHHESVEAQRLSEARVEAALGRMAVEAEERWSMFLVERRHDWDAIKAQLTAVESAHERVAEEIVGLAVRLDAIEGSLASESSTRAGELQEVRTALVAALEGLRQAFGDASDLVESGLPYEKRPEVLEERQLAIRRALRARRGAQP